MRKILLGILFFLFQSHSLFAHHNTPTPSCATGLQETVLQSSALNIENAVAAFRTAKQRVISLDYDRTIRRNGRNEVYPAPSPELLDLISRISKLPNTLVVINSARPQRILDGWFGRLTSIGLAAENGYWYRAPNAEWKMTKPDADISFFEPSREFLRGIADYVHGSILVEKTASLTYVHRNLDPNLGPKLAHDLENILVRSRGLKLRAIHNRKAVEFLPVGIDKGTFLRGLLSSYTHPEETFLLAIGDDEADEDMFQAANSWSSTAWTVQVRSEDSLPTQKSAAHFTLPHVESVLELLTRFSGPS